MTNLKSAIIICIGFQSPSPPTLHYGTGERNTAAESREASEDDWTQPKGVENMRDE